MRRFVTLDDIIDDEIAYTECGLCPGYIGDGGWVDHPEHGLVHPHCLAAISDPTRMAHDQAIDDARQAEAVEREWVLCTPFS